MSRRITDLTNQKFGRLLVIHRGVNDPAGRLQWLCKCDCGREVLVSSNHLRTGNTKSCGCLNDELRRTSRMRQHGHRSGKKTSPTYHSWRAMIARCLNVTDAAWPAYGGSGIRVYYKWFGVNGFKNFLAYVGERPDGTSIDRWPNPSGNYEPGNVRWATKKEQANNRSDQTTFRGKTQPLLVWAGELGISLSTLSQRISGYNWSIERALTTPVRKYRKRVK